VNTYVFSAQLQSSAVVNTGSVVVAQFLSDQLKMNTLKKYGSRALAGGSALLVSANYALAVGTADSDVSGGLDDTSATFALIKPVAIGIVVFFIAKRLLRRV